MPDGGGGTTSSTTTQSLSPDQQKLMKQATPIFSAYLKPGAVSTYPGSSAAKIDPTTVQGQKLALGYATGPMSDTAQSGLTASKFLTSGQALDPRTNPYLQSTINAAIRPITENYEGAVLSGIRDNASLAGQYGYNRQGLEDALANKNYLQTIGDTSTVLSNANYQSGLQAMSSALATQPGVLQSSTLPAQTVNAVGLQRQQLQQQQLDAAIKDYYQKQFLPLNIAQQIASTAFGMPGGSATSTGTTSGGGNMMGNLLGLGSLGVGIAGLAMGT